MTTLLRGWADLREVFDDLAAEPARRWVFRGARCASLQTSLEQAALEFGVPPEKLRRAELGLVRQFARHYHHYALQIPEPDNYLEWFSIMRHYGAPTRLLDVSYSSYVALFFALESPAGLDETRDCYRARLWAIDAEALEKSLRRALPARARKLRQAWEADHSLAKYRTFNALFMGEHPLLAAAVVSPFRRNERLTQQQGTFLCPGDIERPFMDNLRAVLPAGDPGVFREYALELRPPERADILARLNVMNMNHATLFPGLEGLARSLRTRLGADETLLYAPEAERMLEP
jgi:hypothetical protein